MRKFKSCRFLVLSCSLPLLLLSAAQAAEGQPDGKPAALDPAVLFDRMDRLETRLQSLEAEVTQLKREKQAIQEDLARQKQAANVSTAQTTAAGGPSVVDRPREAQIAGENPAGRATPASEWGARLGYQGFPYGQKEGGFYYGFFFDHRLFDEGGGLPLGELDAEIALGIARSGSDHLTVFSLVLLQKQKIEYRQTMLSMWPSLKYYLNSWASYGVRPYVAGGPGIWGDIIESPPLFIGQAPEAKEFKSRKLAIDASANLYEGGQGGAGLEFSLARTGVPIIEHLNFGFEYRYSAWTSGQRFSTYSFSLFSAD